MATILVEVLGNAKQFKAEMASVAASADGASGVMGKMGKAAVVMGAALVGGVAYGLVKSVDAANQFQSSMELIQTQAGGTSAEVKNMSKALVGLATSVGQTPEELSKGLYHVESAGYRGAKALSILKLAAEGAAVGHSDLEQTTTALVAAERSGIKGLGDMSHAMGTLNAIVGAGNMRMDDLTSALGTGVLPAAKAFGLSIADVGGALATMTSNGVPAVNAASGLKTLFATLAGPSKQAAKDFKSIGLSSLELAQTMRTKGLGSALTELKMHLQGAGLTATQTAALLTNAFGKRSSTALLTLVGNLGKMKKATDQVSTGAKTFGANWEETQKTAAFASDRFHASIAALEVQVGAALLPTVTRFTNWLTAELPTAIGAAKTAIGFLSSEYDTHRALVQTVISDLTTAVQTGFAAIGTAIDFIRTTVIPAAMAAWQQYGPAIKSALDTAVTDVRIFAGAIQTVISQVQQNWDTIWGLIGPTVVATFQIVKTAVTTALAIIDGLVTAFSDLLQGHWGAAWGDLTGVVTTAINGVKTIVQTALGALATTAKNLAEDVGKVIAAGVKKAVTYLTGLAGDLTTKISAAIGQVSGWASGEAEKIGRAIVTGVISGVKGAPGAIGHAIKSVVSGGLSWAASNIGSTADEASSKLIGQPLAMGVIEGWLLGTATLPTTLSTGVQNAINAARTVIQGAQTAFQSDFSQLASDANSAFQGVIGGKKTLAESTLASVTSAHDTAGRKQALANANDALNQAKAGGDPDAILAAQQTLDEALYQLQVASLQKQATQQRTQLDARNTLEQRKFDEALTHLQTHLANGHTSYEDAQKDILKLFKSFGVDYGNAGRELGTAFITQLKESIQEAAKGSGSLSTKLSETAAGIKIPHAATGGFVAQTGLAVIHQGETITPAGQGGGGVTVVVNGWVGNDQDIAEKIRNALIRTGRNTTGGALGKFG